MPPPSDTNPTFNVPVVDIAPYLRDPTSPEAVEIIEKVREACTTTGFFQLVGHGIPTALQQDVLKGSAAFFSLPVEEKRKLAKELSVGSSNRGYEVVGNQALQEDTLPDLREGYYIGLDLPPTDPRVLSKAFLMGPNQWPSDNVLSATVFKNPMEAYYPLMVDLAIKVLDIIAAGMPYGPDLFKEFTSNDPIASLRLLHYPPQTTKDKNQLGSGAHTDFGAVTLLLQDGNPGLQVWDKHGERWVNIESHKEAYVVNVGDMLQMWSSGEYKSSIHRVINGDKVDRYSAPFFFDGNIKCTLKPFNEKDSNIIRDQKWLTVEEHMRERFVTTYSRAGGTVV
ncbi:hypothetical protein F5884DRAFT_378141 [Xylogone sp. PMI_703]|nr:hypothetical protein F5884DRAFT_378141 [Xylogone sp. PMI_703]